MRLLLLRHGIAEDAGPATGWRDEPRELTAEGAARMEQAALGMRALGIRVDVILTSPLPRCRLTAEIVARAIGGVAHADRRLAPGARLAGVEDLLGEHPDVASALLCGHQPDLSELVAELTGGGLAEFRKGSLAELEVDALRPRGGRLRALHPPSVLRHLGGAAA